MAVDPKLAERVGELVGKLGCRERAGPESMRRGTIVLLVAQDSPTRSGRGAVMSADGATKGEPR